MAELGSVAGRRCNRRAGRFARLLAEGGHCIAQFCLATILGNGYGGVAKDEKAAFALFRASAEHGDALAQCIWATISLIEGCDPCAQCKQQQHAPDGFLMIFLQV